MITHEEAEKDFFQAEGSGKPSRKICMSLLDNNILSIINTSVKKGSESLVFYPYEVDNKIIFCRNPVYIGPYSTCLELNIEDKNIKVWFDRN
tara:strand:- start:3199 stop:3474 length:276 start_codon:yes stop_codon:yes gene_type:complete